MQTVVNTRQIKHLKIGHRSHAAHSKFITSKPNHYIQGLRYQTCSATGLSQDNPKVKHWSNSHVTCSLFITDKPYIPFIIIIILTIIGRKQDW